MPGNALAEALWARVERTEECWVWTGGRSGEYGCVTVVGQPGSMLTHRAAWLVTHGSIPEGMFVCHHCDNPPCVRPEHLFLGTHADNMRDMFAKGRRPPPLGMTNGNARLTPEQVQQIRERHLPGIHPARCTGRSSSELAAEFGVTRQYIYQLVRGLWRMEA